MSTLNVRVHGWRTLNERDAELYVRYNLDEIERAALAELEWHRQADQDDDERRQDRLRRRRRERTIRRILTQVRRAREAAEQAGPWRAAAEVVELHMRIAEHNLHDRLNVHRGRDTLSSASKGGTERAARTRTVDNATLEAAVRELHARKPDLKWTRVCKIIADRQTKSGHAISGRNVQRRAKAADWRT